MSGRDGETTQPITDGEFACWMAALGPFEAKPHVAVGCSGGADSMALTFLLDRWVRSQGGRLTAITVDHRLRSGSAAEAKQVGAWLRARDIAPVMLIRDDNPLSGNLQAAARTARYALMSEWCRKNDVLHLAVGHHLEDQAETVLLRLARGSGVDGLSAIAPVTETRDLRLLRPLLDIAKARLTATLADAGQDHVEDPSNRNTAFGRVRLRDAAAMLGREGLTSERLASTAKHLARARSALEAETARLLGEAATLFPEGYAIVDLNAFRTVTPEIALRGLSRTLATVAGSKYPPRFDRVQRLWTELRTESTKTGARTLGGCRILPLKSRAPRILVCREPRAASENLTTDGGEYLWDGRFRLRIGGKSHCDLRRLGRKGWANLLADCPEMKKTRVPAAVRPSLPSFWYLDELVSVPHLNYVQSRAAEVPPTVEDLTFAPLRPLTGAGFLSGQSGSESLTLGDAL